MISVVIPVYNAEPYLRRCLDSVLSSVCRDFELILIDDGSADQSPAICREYAARDSRIRLISQENQGASAARNRGLEECRGEWVVFADADDTVSPDFLSMISREENQSQDLLLFDFAYTEQDLVPARALPEPLCLGPEDVPELLRSLLLRRQLAGGGNLNLVSPCGKAYRKALIDRFSIRFSPRLFFGEDKLFNAEYLTKIKSCAYLPNPVYFYRCRQDSLSRRFDPGRIRCLWKTLDGIRNALESGGFLPLLEDDFLPGAKNVLAFVLLTVLSPYSTSPRREKHRLCRELRDSEIFSAALAYRPPDGAPIQARIGHMLLFLCRTQQYDIISLLGWLQHTRLTWFNPEEIKALRENGWLP